MSPNSIKKKKKEKKMKNQILSFSEKMNGAEGHHVK
jgi:hypothetical protein